MSNLSYMQKATDRGQLQIHVTTERGFFPIKDASIRLSYTGNPTEIIEELSTCLLYTSPSPRDCS